MREPVRFAHAQKRGNAMTTDPAKLAADSLADTFDLPIGKRDYIESIINEFYEPVLLALEQDNQILREELASARMLEGQP